MVKCKLISDLHIGSRFSRMDLIEEAFKGNGPILLGGDMCDWINTKDPRHDSDCIMNLSIIDIDGDVLIVSQFTLHASTKKGNRPSYMGAAKPEIAIPLYNKFIKKISHDMGKIAKTGEFGAYMQIEMINDGPVTIIIPCGCPRICLNLPSKSGPRPIESRL